MKQIIPSEAFRRFDDSADEEFYTAPRFVTHIDERAVEYVTNLYREFLPAGGAILDLMSSWVSHLPPEIEFAAVVGLGLNRAELDANPRLTERIVQNLNQTSALPFGDQEFDAACICVSMQYLTNPVAVLAEVGRVLRPEAPIIITFSNRCFPTKAVMVWQRLDDAGHIALIERYLVEAGCWDKIETRAAPPRRGSDPLYGVVARRKGE